MARKYEMVESDRKGLYRIKALKNMPGVKIGDIGGYIESENNLSQNGTCWIYDNATVKENAVVRNSAMVCNNAQVFENAVISEKAKILGSSVVSGNAKIYGSAHVEGATYITENASISDFAQIKDETIIRGNSKIYEYAIVSGCCVISANTSIHGHSILLDRIFTDNDNDISGWVTIRGRGMLKNSLIKDIDDFMILYPIYGGHIIVYRNKANKLTVSFEETLDFVTMPLEELRSVDGRFANREESKECLDLIVKLINIKFKVGDSIKE